MQIHGLASTLCPTCDEVIGKKEEEVKRKTDSMVDDSDEDGNGSGCTCLRYVVKQILLSVAERCCGVQEEPGCKLPPSPHSQLRNSRSSCSC